MLVLSRKRGERIEIDGEITLTVVAIQGGRVQLGFSAPESVTIHREEVRRRIDKEQGAAALPCRRQPLGSC